MKLVRQKEVKFSGDCFDDLFCDQLDVHWSTLWNYFEDQYLPIDIGRMFDEAVVNSLVIKR